MKKLFFVSIALIIGFILTGSVANATDDYVNTSDMSIIGNITNKLNDFLDESNKVSLDVELINQKSKDLNYEIDTLINHNFTDLLGEKYSKEALKLKQNATDLKEKINNLVLAYQENNDQKINDSIDEFNESIEYYSNQLKALDGAVDQANSVIDNENKNTNIMYLVVLIATSIVSLASFIWALNKPDNDEGLKQLQKSISINSLWPFGGAIITYVTYTFASSGGTYTVFWGAILFGFMAYLKSIYAYIELRGEIKK